MIGLSKEGKIWIVSVRERFATLDEKKAKELFDDLFDKKKEFGNLFKLRDDEREKRLLSTARSVELLLDGGIKSIMGVCKAKELKTKKK